MTVAETVMKTASETAAKPVSEAVTEVIQSEGFGAFMDKLGEAASAITDKLAETAPVALDALLSLIRFKGIFELMTDLVGFAVCLALLFTVGKKTWAWVVKNVEECTECAITLFVLVLLPLVACTLRFFCSIFDFTNWLSAIYPEGVLAIKALEAVGIQLF